MLNMFASKLNIFDFRRFYSSVVSINHNFDPVSQQRAADDTEEEGVVSNAERNAELAESDFVSDLTVENSSRGINRRVPDPVEMRKVFNKFDENADRVICSHELSSFMRKLGFERSDEDVLSLVKTRDENCHGGVDFEEFYKLYSSMNGSEMAEVAEHNGDEDDHLWQAFKGFDKNEDGYITVHELQSVLMSLGILEGNSLKKCYKMMESVDSKGNGQVDFKEFKKMMSLNALQSF